MIGKLIIGLETSFRIQLMLSQIILSKMATFQRESNPFAQQLDLMINQSGIRVPKPDQEDKELEENLQVLNSNQLLDLEIHCRVLSREKKFGNSFFSVGRVVNRSTLVEFDEAKEIILAEVHAV